MKQLAPNIYAYYQGGGPGVMCRRRFESGMIAGSDYLLAIDAKQGPFRLTPSSPVKTATGKDFGRLVNTTSWRPRQGNQFFTHAEI